MTADEEAILAQVPPPPTGSVFRLVKVEKVAIPHPYCITSKHVAYASDHGGMLTQDVIRDAEKQAGARCDICRVNHESRTVDEHENMVTLFIAIPNAVKNLNMIPGLGRYLNDIKPRATELGIQGFAFPQKHAGLSASDVQ